MFRPASFRPFDGKVDDPRNVPTFVIESLTFGLAGLLLGSLIDRASIALAKKYPKHKVAITVLKIVVSSGILAIAYDIFPKEFTGHFQRTLPGLAFPAFYYGVQSNIFVTWQQYGSEEEGRS